MKKVIFAALLAAWLLISCACAGEQKPEPYEAEHEHVYGFWYETEDGDEVRYCKICHHAQTAGRADGAGSQ